MVNGTVSGKWNTRYTISGKQKMVYTVNGKSYDKRYNVYTLNGLWYGARYGKRHGKWYGTRWDTASVRSTTNGANTVHGEKGRLRARQGAN